MDISLSKQDYLPLKHVTKLCDWTDGSGCTGWSFLSRNTVCWNQIKSSAISIVSTSYSTKAQLLFQCQQKAVLDQMNHPVCIRHYFLVLQPIPCRRWSRWRRCRMCSTTPRRESSTRSSEDPHRPRAWAEEEAEQAVRDEMCCSLVISYCTGWPVMLITSFCVSVDIKTKVPSQ